MRRRFRLMKSAVLIIAAFLAVISSCRTWSAREEQAAASFNLGNQMRESGRLDEAVEAYKTALSYQENLASASYNLALTLSELGRLDEAKAYLGPLLESDPTNLKVLRAMAWVAWISGDADSSLRYYRRALDIFPGHIPSLNGISEVLESTGRPSQALEYRELLVLLEDSTESRLNLADAMVEAGRDSDALGVYRDVLSNEPDNYKALIGAAVISEQLDTVRDSLTYWLKLADVRNDAEDWWHVARIRLTSIGDYEGGLMALENAKNAGYRDEQAYQDLLAATPPEIRPAVRNLLSDN
jgi:protein O-GlcNAc transferase